MLFKNKIRETALQYADLIRKKDQEIKDFESKYAAIYSREHFRQERGKLEQERQQILKSAEMTLKDLADGFKDAVIGDDALEGARLTDDAKLLTGTFNLTAADLEAMFDRATKDKNRTMQRLVFEYVQSHQVKGFGRVYYTEKDRREAADTLLRYALNALVRPEYAALLADDGQFMRIVPAAIYGN